MTRKSLLPFGGTAGLLLGTACLSVLAARRIPEPLVLPLENLGASLNGWKALGDQELDAASPNAGRDERLLHELISEEVAIASALLARGIAPANVTARWLAFGLDRYSAGISDVNAAASLYLLLIGVSLSLAAGFRRTRVLWLLAAVVILYGLWLVGERRRVEAAGEGKKPVWAEAPWLWLLGLGVAFAAVITVALALFGGGDTEGVYVPPQVKDGQIIPGHVEPRPGAR